MNKFKIFNEMLASKITRAVGTMGCAYIFAIIALISLPAAINSGNILTIVSWVAQTFLQLVLLSIIMVGQNAQSKKTDEHTEKMLNHISNENNRIIEELKTVINKQ